ncbi:zf-DHHC-domain-containing protein [Hypoxylon rubiginosum]|uniref:Zf-DHHC-domain-containing protein n=1 Tax=Hypoxylon rubiginosum TaxID=110542 RepID=A0ACC0CKK6_9PEZI|nr:zf-DHHC-domain-containing protein [Hypoxylon rubiginosum]
MAFLIGSTEPALQRLAIPSVCALIAFLAYTSQWLFANAPDLAPGPLTSTETYTFNGLLLCLWYTYYKACTVDPGRYIFPSSDTKKDKQKQKQAKDSDSDSDPEETHQARIREAGRQTRRWCKKCAAPKPPRAHHCKMCRRCIPKMDHHCPWTSNCVSLQTFPHFLRFLVYTNLSLWTLLYFIFQRFGALWHDRHLPAYLGPTLSQLGLLTVLALVGGGTGLALFVMLVTTIKGWVFNTTMIESWEVERHEAAIERRHDAGSSGSSWWAEGERGDAELSLDAIEFPYDIGIFANLSAAMGTRFPLFWFLPFAGNPKVAVPPAQTPATGTGWTYEENGLNDREGLWPPADPDKLRHARAWRRRRREMDRELLELSYRVRPDDAARQLEAFRRRQKQDLQRWENSRLRILGELEELPVEDYDFVDEAYEYNDGRAGLQRQQRRQYPRRGLGGGIVVNEEKSGWLNADGEHLGDYGVDSDAEFDEPRRSLSSSSGSPIDIESDEDEDVPIAELLRRRYVRTKDDGDT